MTRTTLSLDELASHANSDLGATRWFPVDQQRINLFADATGDHQWIHTDTVRAAAGPYGSTIAHGYLTLALMIPLWGELLDVTGVATKINYGLNKVRFPAPVPQGASVRLVGRLGVVEQITGGIQLTADLTMELRDIEKPACVAEPVFRFYR